MGKTMKRRDFIKGSLLCLACSLTPVSLVGGKPAYNFRPEDIKNVFFKLDVFDVKNKEPIEKTILRMINKLIKQGVEINNDSIVIYAGSDFEVKCRCMWPAEAIDPMFLERGGLKFFRLNGNPV